MEDKQKLRELIESIEWWWTKEAKEHLCLRTLPTPYFVTFANNIKRGDFDPAVSVEGECEHDFEEMEIFVCTKCGEQYP